ncbi:hypothetical protein FKM82_025878, partial [Ascaphus truei]
MHLDKHLLVFSMILICASASHFLDQEWNTWTSKYEKKYATLNDALFRRSAWEATWDKVQKHNQLADQGLTKYRMAMNHFADMTTEERNSKSCLLSKGKSPTPANVPTYTYRKNTNIPEEVDWRKSKCMNPVKNQGSFCGSCWAFATVGVIETRYCIKKKELLLLSEQQLVDCDPRNEGCCGGFPINAMEYVAHAGVMKSQDYEYTQSKLTCLYKPDEIIKLNMSKYYILPGEENMAASVALEGPLTVGIAAGEDLQLYKEGIFDGECAESANHAIIIVGYGTSDDEDYWIIKN